MNTIKWELEDLAFATLYPKVYDEIVRLVAERAPSRDEYLSGVIEQVSGDLRGAKIKATVTGRPKHYYSIYQKMIVRGRDFADIYDLVGIRVLVDSVRDCYAALGAIHARWNPVPGRFKDYIAMPKFNMYQSLHTTVIGPEGKPVELQIRTFAMHRRAEYGVAAHWKYKEDPADSAPVDGRRGGHGETRRRRQRHGLAAPAARLAEGDRGPGRVPRESLRFDLKAAEVYVFTPKGDVIALPAGRDAGRLRLRHAHRGRAPLHRRPGQRPAGAAGVHAGQRRRGRGLHLQGAGRRAEPRLADVRQEPAGPQQDPALVLQGAPRGGDRARQGRDRQGDAQAEPAAPAAADHRDPDRRWPTSCATPTSPRCTPRSARATCRRSPSSAAWSSRSAARRARPRTSPRPPLPAATTAGRARAQRPGRRRQGRVRHLGQAGPLLHAGARATTIVGFVTRGSGVSVHRADCVNVERARRRSRTGMVEVEWAPSASSVFLVAIQVEALDRSRLLSDVTRVLSDQHVNILSASVTTTRDRVAISRFTFEMGDPKHLGHVLKAVRGVDGRLRRLPGHQRQGPEPR